MIITLIGYRGSGKSSVARLLADAAGLAWIDSDDVIEQQAGCTIREIFARDGEAEFRRLETDVFADLTQRGNLIIAAGGGAILAEQNRIAMQQAGPVVWLQADVETLARRMQQDQATEERRPSLTGQSVLDEVQSVLTERLPLYRQAATITIDTEGLSPQQVADQILQELHLTEGDR